MTRIVSLLPAATEIVSALGARESLVGVSHECDYPPEVARLPRVTASPIDQAQTGAEIDAHVRRLKEQGRPVIGVDGHQLRQLAPDLILTQGLCEVCAVADGEVHHLARALNAPPRVLSLEARNLEGIWRDVGAVGTALGLAAEAGSLIASLRARLERISEDAEAGPGRPRVICIEWLEPLYLAGHWVPEMVEVAGGWDVGSRAGTHSVRRSWEEIIDLDPDVVIVMICGFDLARALKELDSLADRGWLAALECGIWVLDGNSYTSRPGPRVVDGTRLIQSALRGFELPGLVCYKRASTDCTD